MVNGTFLFVGYRHFIKSNTVSNSYLKLDNEDTTDIYLISSAKVEEFEKNNNVIKLDEEVFNRLQSTRVIQNNKKDILQVHIELPDNIKRGIKYDYDYMTKEFSLSAKEASNYIKDDYKERSKKRIWKNGLDLIRGVTQ